MFYQYHVSMEKMKISTIQLSGGFVFEILCGPFNVALALTKN